MTDAEIIKALEVCGTYKGKCTDCPAFVKVDRSNCKKVLLGALELINRQKAEVESLKAENDKLAEDWSNLTIEKDQLFDEAKALIEKAKSEARKEFADKLQDRCLEQGGCIYASDIGAVLNEKAGDTE